MDPGSAELTSFPFEHCYNLTESYRTAIALARGITSAVCGVTSFMLLVILFGGYRHRVCGTVIKRLVVVLIAINVPYQLVLALHLVHYFRLGLSTAEPRHGYAVWTLRVHPPNSPNPFCSQRTYLARSDIMKLKCLMTYTWNQWASYYLSMNIIYLVLMVSVCCLWGCRAPRVFWEGLLTSQILSKNYELLQKTSCLAVRVSKSEHCVALLK